MKRLFTFGCSYTSYCWPTWSEFLSVEFDEYQNWGISGIGNRAIAERVAEAHAKNQFTEDDTIIVQWSTHLRNDWWHMTSLPERPGTWKTAGSIFNYMNAKLYDKKWINTFFFEPAFFMHTLNHIMLTQGLLNSTKATWFMTSIGDIRNLGSDIDDNIDYKECITPRHEKDGDYVGFSRVKELEVYNKPIWIDHKDHWLTPFNTFVQTQSKTKNYKFIDSKTKEQFADLHPTPNQHLEWIISELSDKLTISDSTIKNAKLISDVVDEFHRKFTEDKREFAKQVRESKWIPENGKITWPTKPHGF